MIILMTILYIGCVLVAFKFIKIKPNPVSIGAAALIGILMLGGIVIGWKISAPMTGQMTLHRKITFLLSNQDSKQFIKEIHVKQDQPVKKGAVLYETDPTPNQYQVDQLTAQVAAAQQSISALEAAVEVAKASVEKAQAEQGYSKAGLDTADRLLAADPKAIAKTKYEVTKQTYLAAESAVQQALASQQAAEFALSGAKEAIKSTQAELNTARLNLKQCVVRAPADGYVMNWQAVEGTMTTTVARSAQGAFMDTTATVVGAVFPMNMLKNVEPGNTVEIAFKSLPGQIATGKVDAVLEYTGEGQLEPSGVVPVAADLGSKGFLVVTISLEDEQLAKDLPLGAAGTTAIYTNSGTPFHIISKMALRMKGWLYYLPL